MSAQKPLAFGPEELRVIYAAFDDAWEIVKVDYIGDLQTLEVGRHRLANAMMTAYRNGVTEREALKVAGIALMQRWI
jgi:hypothetical protein